MTPNDTLRNRAGGTSTRACADRIEATYLMANRSQREEGCAWYVNALSLALLISAAHDLTIEQSAGLIAQLSPRLSWSRNVTAAHLVASGETSVPGVLGRNIKSAIVTMNSDDPASTINGPKTSAFYRNILGDLNAVTIDVWAARTALGIFEGTEVYLKRVGVYDAIAHAYKVAAIRLRMHPAHVQAVCWIVERGRSN